MKFIFALLLSIVIHCRAFSRHCINARFDSLTQMAKGKKAPESNTAEPKEKPAKFTLGALVQLITMGAGAPSLGEYKRTDENGRMFFELEANNFVDAEGNSMQTKQRYFTDGYVDDRDEGNKPPGFFQNLLSGGRLQEDWERSLKKGK